MFENLTQRLSGAFSSLRGQRELTEENTADGLRAVRQALLEADVQFQLARDFSEKVRERLQGEKLIQGVDPSQQFIQALLHSPKPAPECLEGLCRFLVGQGFAQAGQGIAAGLLPRGGAQRIFTERHRV